MNAFPKPEGRSPWRPRVINVAHNAVDNFLDEVLQREIERQTLQTQVMVLRSAFEDIAVEISSDDEWFSEDFLAINEVEETDLPSMHDHAFLSHSKNDEGEDGYRFKHEFIPLRFRASKIIEAAEQVSLTTSMVKWVSKELDGDGPLTGQIVRMANEKQISRLAEAHAGTTHETTKRFLFHVITRSVVNSMQNKPRPERGARIVELLGSGNHLTDLNVSGTVTGFTLSGVEIERSVFSNTKFDIRMNDVTFRNCGFRGTLVIPDSCQIENSCDACG